MASLIHVPQWVSVELNTLIFKFFWSGKRDLVARCVVVQPSCLGGFSVVDFQCSASSWVSFIVFLVFFPACHSSASRFFCSSLFFSGFFASVLWFFVDCLAGV